MDPNQRLGNHYNSIEYANGRLYVVAHNFEKGSFTVELEWPSLRIIDLWNHSTSGIHNLWIRDDGVWLSCDTMKNGLIDLKSDTLLWQTEKWSLTRGLAATSKDIYVGSSEHAPREMRPTSETGIWIVEATTMRTSDYHWLGNFGGVHELRLIDEPDLCHAVGPGPSSLITLGVSAADFWRDKRLSAAERRLAFGKEWQVELGEIYLTGDGSFSLNGPSLALATMRDAITDSEIVVSGRISLEGRRDAHCAIIGDYLGPGDENMIAVILSGSRTGQINLGVWVNAAGEWHNPFTKTHRELFADVTLVVGRSDVRVLLNESKIFSTDRKDATLGKVGIRGIWGTVSGFALNTKQP
jgi:uncharacterized cupin superfamily protein